MGWMVISAALCNLGLGFYLGSKLLQQSVLPVNGLPDHGVSPILELIREPESPSGSLVEMEAAAVGSMPTELRKATPWASEHTANQSKQTWSKDSTDIRQDIATLYERIRYSFSANDKQLARMIAAELRTRIPIWQKLLAEKMPATVTPDDSAKNEATQYELCLAQTETLQTNLALLDWSEETNLILKKLERELEAVKHLLPNQC